MKLRTALVTTVSRRALQSNVDLDQVKRVLWIAYRMLALPLPKQRAREIRSRH